MIRQLLQYNINNNNNCFFSLPFFMIMISLLQCVHFLHFCSDDQQPAAAAGQQDNNCRNLTSSPLLLILDPCYTFQIWRYAHLLTNLAGQFVLGIPLELAHSHLRVGLLYLLGVMSGSLLSFAFDRDRYLYLVGASGGVYTLLFAHVANIPYTKNWHEMKLKDRLVSVVKVILAILTIVDIIATILMQLHEISYMCHMGGAVTGILLGPVILRTLHSKLLKWTMLASYALLVYTCAFVIAAQQVIHPSANNCD